MLDYINIFISGLILALTEVFFAKIILRERIKEKAYKVIITILLVAILHALVFNFLDNTVKTFANLLVNIGMFNYLFKLGFKKSVFLTFVYFVLLILPDMLTLGIAINIFGMTKEYCYEVFAGSILGNLIVGLGVVLITYIFRKPLGKLLSYKLATNKKIVLVSILGLVCISFFFYKLITTFELSNNIIIYIAVIIVFVVILFSLFKQKIDNDNLLVQYDELLNFMKTYEVEIENQRILRHETQNQLITIKSKIIDNTKDKEILSYIDSILGEKIDFIQEKYAKYQYLPANGLKALFYFKTMEAEKKDILVDINIAQSIEKSFLGKLSTDNFKQLGRIIGVYLDNAIEASNLSIEKKLGIEMYDVNKNIELIITNTYLGTIEKEKLGQKVFSTKGKNRGHGLLLVKNIINNCNMFSQETTIMNELYIQKIIIKRENKKSISK